MKTLALIKIIYEKKLAICLMDGYSIHPNYKDIIEILMVLSNLKPLKYKQNLRYKIQKSLYNQKRTEKILYDYCKYLLYLVQAEKNYSNILKRCKRINPYHEYWCKSKPLCRIRRIHHNKELYVSYDNIGCKLLVIKVTLIKHFENLYMWEVSFETNWKTQFLFLTLHIKTFLRKYEKICKSIHINYYMRGEKDAVAREFYITSHFFNKNIKNNINVFSTKFYDSWKRINLDDYYNKIEEGYYQITCKMYYNNTWIIKMNNMVLPSIRTYKPIVKGSVKQYKNINHDFRIIKR